MYFISILFRHFLNPVVDKFGAWIHQTLTQRETALKSMSSPGSIQEWPLERPPKKLETAFLWQHTFDSIASLCNNGVKLLIFIPVLLILTGKFASAGNHFRVESLPRVAKQGEVCLISVLGPASLKSIYVEFQGIRFPLAFSEQNGTYEGLIGIDMDTQPSTYEIKIVMTDGGSKIHSSNLSLKVEKVDFGIQELSLPSSMVDLDKKTLERVNKEEKQLNSLFRAFRGERLWRGAFIRPVEGEVSTAFGLSRIINGQRRSPHTGVDLQAEEGTPVLACNSGIVALIEPLFFSGKSVILDHGWGFYSMYFHLSEVLVKKGDRVVKGAILGRVGSTGRSTGPHLHWGIRMNGARVDPLSLLNIKAQRGDIVE